MNAISAPFAAKAPSLLARIKTHLARERAVRAVKRELHALSDRELNDIGISRADINAVARGA